MNKTCSAGHPCNYRYQSSGSVGWGCNYTGYCDFQLPRDSRLQPVKAEWIVKEVDCTNIEKELNAFSEQGFKIWSIRATQYTKYEIIVYKEEKNEIEQT